VSGIEGQNVEIATTSGKTSTLKENTEQQNAGSNRQSDSNKSRVKAFNATDQISGAAQQTPDKELRDQLMSSGEAPTAGRLPAA